MSAGATKRVLLVSPKPPPAHGAAKAVQTLLDGSGGPVQWVHIDARYADNVSGLQKVRLRKFFRLFKYLWQTAARSLRCDAVVLTPSFQRYTFLKDSPFIWLCWLLRRRVIAWYHMSYSTLGEATLPALFRAYVRITLRRVHRHVCVAERLVGELPDFLPRDRCTAVPNGIAAYGRRDGGNENGNVKVLYLSHMGEAKGWRVLLDAAAKLCDRHQGVEFEFYGEPAYETTGEDVAEAFGATPHPDRVRYVGFADEETKRRLFGGEVDALCFPSFNEAFPITILEAMSAGLPVIASDVGGIGDALVDGEGGRLVLPGDGEALVAALEELVSHPEKRLRWGQENRRRYEARFTEQAFREGWCRVVGVA